MNLPELKANIEKAKKSYNEYIEESNKKRIELNGVIKEWERQYNIVLAGVDLDKIQEAESFMEFRGLNTFPKGDDIKAANDAINWFAGASSNWLNLNTNFFGTKDYSGWSHQREDNSYGYGPKHGSTVFSIGLQSDYRNKELTESQRASAIYYLEMLKAGKLIKSSNAA